MHLPKTRWGCVSILRSLTAVSVVELRLPAHTRKSHVPRHLLGADALSPQGFWFLSSEMNTWTRLFPEQVLVLSAAVIPFIDVTTSLGDFCSPGSPSSKRY